MGWKSAQSRLKNKRKTKLALIVLGAIVTLIILGQAVNFTKVLFSPWNFDGVRRQTLWDGTFSINLVLKTNSISVVSFNPSLKKINIINLLDNTFMEVPQGFGQWQLRSIYNLGREKLLKDSLSSFLGIPIDGFLQFNGPLEQKKAADLIDLMRQNPINIFTLLPNLKTDLTLWELIHLKWGISQVRFDKIKNIDLLKLNILDKNKLADGTEVQVADSIRLDSVLSDFADSKIASEHLSIAIFNATSHIGLAQKGARLITNLGGNVIITSNTNKNLDKTQIIGAQSATLTRLTQIFGSSCPKCDKIDLTNLGIESSRAQINVILGEDFYLRCCSSASSSTSSSSSSPSSGVMISPIEKGELSKKEG